MQWRSDNVRVRSMFIVPALAALFCFVCLRPHEVFEPLRLITFNVMVGLLALAYALDLRLGLSRPRLTALTAISAAYFGLAALSLLVKAPERLATVLPALVAPFIGFLALSQGIANLRGLVSVDAPGPSRHITDWWNTAQAPCRPWNVR